jgi:hypothetical protein
MKHFKGEIMKSRKKTIVPLNVQSIRSGGQKQRPYVYLSAEFAEKTGLKGKNLVEWELVDRGRLRLVKLPAGKRRRVDQAYPLKVQTIKSKAQRPRLYVCIPVPLAAAIRLRHGEAVNWEYDGISLFLVRNL